MCIKYLCKFMINFNLVAPDLCLILFKINYILDIIITLSGSVTRYLIDNQYVNIVVRECRMVGNSVVDITIETWMLIYTFMFRSVFISPIVTRVLQSGF